MSWIDVNKRLPDLHEDFFEDGEDSFTYLVSEPVLVVYNGEDKAVAVYEIDEDKGMWVDFGGGDCLHSVTHWRPLPPFPEERDIERDLRDCRNELCLKCGNYHEAHNGACDGCRWK